MLTLTENASAVVRQISERMPDTEQAGLRLASAPDGAGLTVSAVPEATPGDQVLQQDGAVVYLEDVASVALSDQVLDATVDDQGTVAFSLAPQS